MWKDIINKDLIIIDPDIKSKDELFEGMVNHVYNLDKVINKKVFLEALRSREEMANTELIEGVALPHARSNVVDKLFLSIIIHKEGIDYKNSEMGPAKIIFFFGCSDKTHREYLQFLAKSSRLLKSEEFQNKLLKANSPDEIMEILNEYEEQDSDTESSSNYLMILTLNKTNKLSEVMSAMVECGITNASVLDGISMAKKLSYEMPIFAGLSYMAQGKSKSTEVIMAHISKKETAHKLADLLMQNGIDLNKMGTGFIQVIKTETIIGNFEEEIEL
jgi:mannitol/fructose-specific phosphotransferase system IIA component (Ntr-type)